MAIGDCYIFGCIFGGNIDVERIAVALSYSGVLNAIKCCAIICVSFLRDLENLCWFGKINLSKVISHWQELSSSLHMHFEAVLETSITLFCN